jgi:hypothetical protein
LWGQRGVGHLDHGVRAAGLGHAEQVGGQVGFARSTFGRQRLQHGAAPDAGQVALGEVGMVGHGLACLSPAGDERRPFPLQQRQRAARLKYILREDGCAGRERLQHNHCQAAHPEERHWRIDAIGRGDAAMARQNIGVAHQAAVRVHDGFRQRRRPGRGDQDEIIRGYYLVFGQSCQRRTRFRARPRRRPGALALRPDVYPPQVGRCRLGNLGPPVGEPWQRVLHALDEIAARDGSAHEYYLHIGVPQQSREFATGCESRQGNRQRADARGSQPTDKPLGAVGEQDADPGPFADTGGQQGVGQLQGSGVRLREGQSLIIGDEEVAVGCGAPDGEELGDAGRHAAGRRILCRRGGSGHQPMWTGMCE